MFLFISFILLGLGVLAIQTTVFSLFPQWFGRPDLVFVLLVFVAYKFPWHSGLFIAFALGWMLDVVSGMFLGTYLFMAVIVFCLVKLFSQNSPVKETVYQVPLVGLSYFVLQCSFYVFFLFMHPGVLPPWSWGRVVRETFILLVAAVPCFVFFNWMYERLISHRFSPKIMKRRTGNRFR